MNGFSGKYNYCILVLMLVGLIIFSSIFLLIVSNAATIYEVNSEEEDKLIRWFGYLFILLSSAFFVNSLFRGLKRRRFNLFITDEEMILKNIFTGKEDHVKIQNVKGFSTSDIHARISHYHAIIIYADYGRTYEFPQFMLRNFKELKKAFKIAGIEYFGHEPYTLSWYGKRKFKFL